jgi:hypothetical protein
MALMRIEVAFVLLRASKPALNSVDDVPMTKLVPQPCPIRSSIALETLCSPELVEAFPTRAVRPTIVDSATKVLYRGERSPDFGPASKRPRAELVRRELPHRGILSDDDPARVCSCQSGDTDTEELAWAYSAAMIIGNGRLALPTAGTAERSTANVRFGEVLSLYCVGRRWSPSASPQ